MVKEELRGGFRVLACAVGTAALKPSAQGGWLRTLLWIHLDRRDALSSHDWNWTKNHRSKLNKTQVETEDMRQRWRALDEQKDRVVGARTKGPMCPRPRTGGHCKLWKTDKWWNSGNVFQRGSSYTYAILKSHAIFSPKLKVIQPCISGRMGKQLNVE